MFSSINPKISSSDNESTYLNKKTRQESPIHSSTNSSEENQLMETFSLFQPPKCQVSLKSSSKAKKMRNELTTNLAINVTPDFKCAKDCLNKILTLCKHPIWIRLAVLSSYGKPHGVHITEATLKDFFKISRNDHDITNTFEIIKNTSKVHLSYYSPLRHDLTKEFYSIFASLDYINNHNLQKNIRDLNNTLDQFNNKLNYQQYEYEHKTCAELKCCF